MKYYFIIILFISLNCFSQKKVSSHLMKGEWMIKNDSNNFYNSDTLVFYKKTNPDKRVPLHNGKRPFLEFDYLFEKGIPRVEIKLDNHKFSSRAICSDVFIVENEGVQINQKIWGNWNIKNNILEINSPYHYNWKFRIKEISKTIFIYNGKEYKTIKMLVIKKKFENFD